MGSFQYRLYTCISKGNKTYVSTIDHFIYSEGLKNNLIEAGVLHLADNMSDHEPDAIIKIDSIECDDESTDNTASGNSQNWKKHLSIKN